MKKLELRVHYDWSAQLSIPSCPAHEVARSVVWRPFQYRARTPAVKGFTAWIATI